MYRNQVAEALQQAGLDAARLGDFETAHRQLDETLRFLEADEHDTGFSRAAVMINLASVLIQRGADYYAGAFHTLDHAESTSSVELSKHYQPYVGYVGISPADQATIHLQICAADLNMGILYERRAVLREAEAADTGAGDHRAAHDQLWLAKYHFRLARDVDPNVPADFRQALGDFLIHAGQEEFWNMPVSDPDHLLDPDQSEEASA